MIHHILQANLRSFLSLLQQMWNNLLLKLKITFPWKEDGALSNGPVHGSYIYKSKYDVATYTEKTPHISYGEKVDLIKNVFVPGRNFCFPEMIWSFKYEWLPLFPWLCYSPSKDASSCLPSVFYGHYFPTRVKNLFSQPFRTWPSAVSYFRAQL